MVPDDEEHQRDPHRPEPAPGDARATRGDFLGYVAHEVRNPLSTALWSAELLARMASADRSGPRGEKLTAMCLRSLGRVRQLIEDHFLGERLEAGGIALRPEPIDVLELLGDIAARRPDDVGAATLDVEPELVVDADRALLERALEALLVAAGREATPVQVAARQNGGLAELRVSGAPLGADALADPRKGSPSDPRGRSLALPLVRRVAGALGGSVDVQDGAFVLCIPREAAYTSSPGHPTAHS